MPKELIHFTIAERTADLLHDTPFAPSLAAQPHALLLGSVFHDALFYAVTPGGLRLERLAHKLHGAQEQDTYALIRIQAAHAATCQTPLTVSLLVGMVSHLFADAVMHPMVWYFTGDYYGEEAKAKSIARQRHRALESLMDMVACPDKMRRARYRLRTMLRHCPDMLPDGLPVPTLAAKAGMPAKTAFKELQRAWRLFSILQAYFPVPWLAHSLYALRPISPNRLAEVACLFYCPQLMRQADKLRGEIHFTHPVTDEPTSASLDVLMNEASERAAALCQSLVPTLFEGKPLDLQAPGPSMDAGLTGVPTDAMQRYAANPFPELD